MRFSHDSLINLMHKAIVEGLWSVEKEVINLALKVADLHILLLKFELLIGT